MERNNYKLIVTIVGHGKSAKIVDIARRAGANNEGAILTGHGAAVRVMLGISIEPEKDIVLTLVEADKANGVMKALEYELNLNEPHKGICFLISLEKAIGLSLSGITTA